MNASPARSLIERAAEAYGYDREYLIEPEVAVPTPVAPELPVRLVERETVDAVIADEVVEPLAPADRLIPDPDEGDPAGNPFVLSLSKHRPSLGGKKRTAPFDAASGVAQDRLRQAQGERESTQEPAARRAVDPIALAEAGYVVPGAPPSTLSEEFRIAKRPLIAAAFGSRGAAPVERGRLLLVCSGSPGEGKTFCALNLALSLAAERDTHVLLVDGDVAKPDILPRLGLREAPGFMDAITDPAIDPDALVRETGIANLSVLGAGGAVNDATERLGSARARAVLDQLVDADPRRIVVIDSPPVLVASPATALALHVGQAVLIVRADRTTEAELRRSYALLSGCDAIHLLLNGVTYASGEPRFGSYYAAMPG